MEKRGLGHAVLHGNIPGPDRRKLLDRFRNDADCRVFLSTDAGGTGLNLQTADTVINLEVPWNPAVLEQRIARVHRMGQHRPVHVFNLVMRDSIEERVLRVVEQKRSLFEALFSGGGDEIALDGMGQQAFLDTMRDLFGPATPAPAEAPPPPATPAHLPAEATAALAQAGIVFLEALAAALTTPGQLTTDPRTGQPALLVPLPAPAILQRCEQALAAILRSAGQAGSPKG